MISRRRALNIGVSLGAGLALAPLAKFPAQAAQSFTGATYLPPSYEALMWGVYGFVERLQDGLGDKESVAFYDSATLMKADEQTAGLRSHVIDFMFHISTYISRSFEITGLLGLPSLVGDLYRNPERLKAGSPLFNLLQEQLVAENIHLLSLGGGMIEPQYIWSAKEPITSLSQLSGRKVRVVGYEASTALERFGVIPVRIPSAETYLALQRGTVDAVVGNISTVIARNLHEQLKYCYKLPVTAYAFGAYMLHDRWQGLGPAEKQAFATASQWYDDNAAEYVNHKIYPDDFWKRIDAAGIEQTAPTSEDEQNFAAASREIWDWWKERVGGEIGGRAIDLALGRSA
jgi:TRAP-type C4-dicarboxylate transport system substrate-binding protein